MNFIKNLTLVITLLCTPVFAAPAEDSCRIEFEKASAFIKHHTDVYAAADIGFR